MEFISIGDIEQWVTVGDKAETSRVPVSVNHGLKDIYVRAGETMLVFTADEWRKLIRAVNG